VDVFLRTNSITWLNAGVSDAKSVQSGRASCLSVPWWPGLPTSRKSRQHKALLWNPPSPSYGHQEVAFPRDNERSHRSTQPASQRRLDGPGHVTVHAGRRWIISDIRRTCHLVNPMCSASSRKGQRGADPAHMKTSRPRWYSGSRRTPGSSLCMMTIGWYLNVMPASALTVIVFNSLWSSHLIAMSSR
jgi:hypothetical protein